MRQRCPCCRAMNTGQNAVSRQSASPAHNRLPPRGGLPNFMSPGQLSSMHKSMRTVQNHEQTLLSTSETHVYVSTWQTSASLPANSRRLSVLMYTWAMNTATPRPMRAALGQSGKMAHSYNTSWAAQGELASCSAHRRGATAFHRCCNSSCFPRLHWRLQS